MTIAALKALKKNTALSLNDGTTAFYRGIDESGATKRVLVADAAGSKKTRDIRAASVASAS